MEVMYSDDIGLTGRLETLSFHGLLVGKTWHPPSTVFAPDATGGLADVVCVAAVGFGRDVARAVAAAFAVAAAIGEPGRWGSALSSTPPEGVGIACTEGPLQAVTTTSAITAVILSRRLGASARSRITAVASPEPGPGS
jgi:hypothetical protein